MTYSKEFLSQIKEQIKNKLIELNAFGDEELPDYITVMVANKKKRSSMRKDLQLFLGEETDHFTEWLHDFVASKSRESIRNDKSRKSSRLESSSKKKSHFPSPSKDPSLDVVMDEDILSFHTEENEFIDELSNEIQSESKPTEQRRVVATSSLKNTDKEEPIDNKPILSSVIKVSDDNHSLDRSVTSSTKSKFSSLGNKLLKQALSDVKNNAIKHQEKSVTSSKSKRSLDKREVTLSQNASSLDSDESEIPRKMTKFVVTMNDETPIGLKPSVKSRLGPRVVTHGRVDTSAEVTDARSILISRKMTNADAGETAVKVIEDDESKKANDRSNVPSTLQRCKYWPNCRNQESCEFFHPKEECKSFPNCRYGTRCLYIHPPCRYGVQCSRSDCAFTHPPMHIDVVPVPMIPKNICRYYPNCKLPRGTCPYFHPTSMPHCRFGADCLKRGTTCPFIHPSVTAIPAVNKLKWIAPSKSPGDRNSTNPPEVSVDSDASANENALGQSAEVISI